MPAPTQLPAATSSAAFLAVQTVANVPGICYKAWANAVRQVWANPHCTPQQVLDLQGIYAGVWMASSAALAGIFATYGDPTIQADLPKVLALVKPFTTNADGTVTVNS